MQRATAAEVFGEAEFIRLTTFKRDGTAVPTTVWCVADGDDILVTTQDTTGNAKRLRHSSRVLVAPSSRTGNVEDGVADVEGTATLFRSVPEQERLTGLLKVKYGLLGRALMALRGMGERSEHSVGIRISTSS